jgi:hypothetical protein
VRLPAVVCPIPDQIAGSTVETRLIPGEVRRDSGAGLHR